MLIKMTSPTTMNTSDKGVLEYLDEGVPGYSSFRNFYVVALLVMAGLAIPLNIVVIVKLVQRHFWRSTVYILLFQLAIADLLVAGFCIVGDAVWNITLRWLVGDAVCRMYKFLQMFSLYASTFILTSISIDRCISVLFPLSRSGGKGKLQRVRRMGATSWICAMVCAAPQAVIFHTETAPFVEPFEQCVTHGTYKEPWQEILYGISTVIIMFFGPVLIMISSYLAIFTRITKESKHASGRFDDQTTQIQETHVRRELYSHARRKVLYMTLVFAIVFVICWAPYYVGMFYYIFNVIGENDRALNLIFCFGMCTAIINPLIYGTFNLRPSKLDHDNTTRTRSLKLRYEVIHHVDRNDHHNPRMIVQFKTYPQIKCQ